MLNWQKQHGSFFAMNEGVLQGSIIYLNGDDGNNPRAPYCYSLQINTADGGLLSIGYIHNYDFNEEKAKRIVEMALAENKDYDWWQANKDEWFTVSNS